MSKEFMKELEVEMQVIDGVEQSAVENLTADDEPMTVEEAVHEGAEVTEAGIVTESADAAEPDEADSDMVPELPDEPREAENDPIVPTEEELREALLRTMSGVDEVQEERVPMMSGHYRIVNAPLGHSAKTLEEMDLGEVEWLIENKLPTGLAMLIAAPKSAKSYFAYQLSVAVATGGTFLDEKVTPGTVVYFDLEASARRSRNRLRKMGADLKNLSNFIIVNGGIEELEHGLEDQLMAYKNRYPDLRLVVIDTLSKVFPNMGAASSYRQESRMFGSLRKAATNLGITVLVIHHQKQNSNKRDPFQGGYGSNGLPGNTDVNMAILKKDKKDPEGELLMEGNDIEDVDLMCRFENFEWYVVGPMDEVINIREAERLHKNPSYKAIAAGKARKGVNGIYSFTPSELISDARDWGIVGCREPKRLARFIRDNQIVLEQDMNVQITERRTANGHQFILTEVA